MRQVFVFILKIRSNDKRKIGVKELEAFIKENVNLKSDASLVTFIKSLKNLADVSMPYYIRKASFLGFTTLSSILRQINNDYTTICHLIILNILFYFKDNDVKIVCAAAESLYNIMKYFPALVIQYFNDIFEGLLLINVNPDQEVRNLAQNLDSLLKEIINFSFQDNQM